MKKKSHAALFIGFLMASCIIIPVVFLFVTWQTNKVKNTPPQEANAIATEAAPLSPSENSSENPPENVTENTEAAVSSESMTTVDASYFDDALFIGDSRTVGLKEYGTLSNATYFANTGLSIYDATSDPLDVDGLGSLSLHDLLTSQHYGKIYLMLGINELGFNLDQTVNKYSELVGQLKALQPDAIIYIEANLHVTAERSASDSTFNNPNIDQFNSQIASLVDHQTVFYLDANELFDDTTGNLNPEYTNDNTHPLGKYYATWCDWLCQHAVVR